MSGRQRKQPENRRRTGCFQCKDKHVQCTEEKPRCRRCERLGLECVRGLKLLFREDAIQRGIHFGREGTWSKRRKGGQKPPVLSTVKDFSGLPLDRYVGRWIFLNTTYGDFSGEGNFLDNGDIEISTPLSVREKEPSPSSPPSLSPGRPLSHPLSFFPQPEGYLLNYFIKGIGPNCSLSPSYNPYISLITPLCFSDNTLKNTLLAVSANQLRLLGDTRFARAACVYKQNALQGLSQNVNRQNLDLGTVATVLMLCFHDISDGCAPSWITHLKGGLQMTGQVSSSSGETEALKRFFNMYFVAHDIMGRTAFEDKWEGQPFNMWLENDDMEEIDMTMGCSRELMSLISRISTLAQERKQILKSRELTSSDNFHFRVCSDEIDDALKNLKQKLPPHSVNSEHILRIAETKRLTAMLYLKEKLGCFFSATSSHQPIPSSQVRLSLDVARRKSSSPSSSSSSLSSSTASSTSVSPRMASVNSITTPTTAGAMTPMTSTSNSSNISYSKPRLIAAIIKLIDSFPTPLTTLIWPLFVVGNAGLDDEGQRRFVLDSLRSIQKTRNLGSVRRARMTVERAFRVKDLDLPSSRAWGDDGPGVISLA